MSYEFKERKSAKLKSPEWIAYDEKGAAFIIAPFSGRRDIDFRKISEAINNYDAVKATMKDMAAAIIQVIEVA